MRQAESSLSHGAEVLQDVAGMSRSTLGHGCPTFRLVWAALIEEKLSWTAYAVCIIVNIISNKTYFIVLIFLIRH